MGASCGGPIVLLQAKMRMNGWGSEEYLTENIDVEEDDIPRVVSELLDLPKEGYEY